VERFRYRLMTRLARRPALAMPLARVRGEGELVREDTDLLIESFPRSASSFYLAAFNIAQEPARFVVAHHTHAPGHVIAAIRLGVPALVLVREPGGAVISSVIRHPDRTCTAAVRGYVDFHEPLLPYRGAFVVGTYDEVVRGDAGLVTRRVNARFGTAFAEFEPTEDNVARALREIDQDWRERRGGGEHLERIVPRPSAVRDQLKGEIRERYRREVPARLRERAERMYAAFAPASAGAGERP
jgi:hypothetical protein